MSEHQPVGDLPHLRIETEAGKELWFYVNNHYGSSVWGRVEDGILAVEAEMRKQLAETWDEGYNAGYQYGLSMYGEYRTDNPYRDLGKSRNDS